VFVAGAEGVLRVEEGRSDIRYQVSKMRRKGETWEEAGALHKK
jgi:hypothetical protein